MVQDLVRSLLLAYSPSSMYVATPYSYLQLNLLEETHEHSQNKQLPIWFFSAIPLE